jgi:hypothetical protein
VGVSVRSCKGFMIEWWKEDASGCSGVDCEENELVCGGRNSLRRGG